MGRERLLIGVLAIAVMALAPQPGLAQSSVATGQIFGTAADPEGAMMPGVLIQVKNQDTGFTRGTVTDASGFFRIDLIPSGVYDVRADLAGFKSEVRRGVEVTLGSSIKVEFILALSAIEEEIVVTADSPIIETTNPSVAHGVSDDSIANLPLNGRDFTDFVVLTPGAIASTDEAESGRGGINISARGIQNSFNIDGSNNQSSFFGEERGGTRPPFTFSQASIKEMQVIRNSYNLEFSAGGGVINAITKSGTNEIHGEVFGYFRNESMVEDTALGESPDDFEQWQYGFSAGGPFIRDKLHWFVGVDAQDLGLPSFRNFDDFPEGREPEWEAITGLDYDEEIGDIGQTNDALVFMVKFDWQLSSNHLMTLRNNYSSQEGENLTNDFRTSGWSTNGLEENSFNSLVVSLNSVFSENSFNEAIVQYALEERPRSANVTSIPETQVGFGFDGVFGQNQFLPNFLDEQRFQIIDNFTYYAGKHTLKAGINLDFVDFDDGFFRYGGGYYRYGFGWDSFFEDNPDRYRQAFSDFNGEVQFFNNYYVGFLQDEWRASSNFTLTYGIRYQWQEHDQPKETNPLYPATGTIPQDKSNWAPRAGFAWDINGDGKSVLRGGAGIFYDYTPTLLDANAMLANGVRVVRVTLSCSRDDCPTYPNTFDSLGDLPVESGSDIFVYDSGFENPRTTRLSLGFDREIARDFALGADVVWGETKRLQRKWDQNISRDGGTTPDGRPTYETGVNYPELGQIMEFHSDARSEFYTIVLRASKRFSNNWALDASYTYGQVKDNDSNERSVSSSGDYPMQQDDLSYSWGYANFDIRHKFVASAAYQLPANFLISTIVHYRSGFPYSAMDSRDNNGDGYTRNERAMYQDSAGNWVLAGRNTYRQPANKRWDMRLSWTANFSSRLSLELILDVFNITDEANWWTTNDTFVEFDGSFADDFGERNRVGDPRNFQLGAKLRF
jgi:outer membrane receptor protein involved in Fe transport